MEFDWDSAKYEANLKKHGISCDEAKHIFDGPTLTRADDRQDYGENRNISLGALPPDAVLVVVHTERRDKFRLISARKANRRERPVRQTAVKGRCTMTISRKRKKEIEAIKDKDIDYSDIPETDADFWANAELIEPDRTQHVTLRVKKSVLDHFKAEGKKGYQTRINAVLESYVRAQEKNRNGHHETA